jgi:hypothetical protein
MGKLVLMLVAVAMAGCTRSADDIRSVEEAREFLVGTWVYTQPITPDRPNLMSWMRWQIRADGTLTQQTMSPSDDRWGPPEDMKYTPITAKYVDTGERYYGLDIPDTVIRAVITPGGDLYVQIGEHYAGVLSRAE